MRDVMTLAQFRATGRDCADLGAEVEGCELGGVAGRVYAGGAFLERTPGAVGGEWCLTLANEGWQTNDLAALEARLYLWALAERPEDMGADAAFAQAVSMIGEAAGTEELAEWIAGGGHPGDTSLDDLADTNQCAVDACATLGEHDMDAAGDLIDDLHAWAMECRDDAVVADDETRSNGPRRGAR